MFKIPLPDVGGLLAWTWKHRGQLDGVPSDPDEFIDSALSGKGPDVYRVGSTLRQQTAAGASRTLAFLGQAAHHLGDIEQAVAAAGAGRRLLSAASLPSLQQVSMVTLGLTAVTPVVLAAQFGYLRKRFNELQKELRQLEQLLEARYLSELESGLEVLESGVRQQNAGRIEGALQKCNDAAVFFANRVKSAVADNPDRRGLMLLNRHLAVAVCGTTRCYVALGEDAEALKALTARGPALRAAARAVFQATAARNPERFLAPELAADVTLEAFVALFEQARLAGALDEADDLQMALAGRPSAAEFFESMRGRLFRPKWRLFRPKPQALLAELRDATAAVEETNRVLSLIDFLEESARAGKPALDGLTWFDQEAKGAGAAFFAWGF